MKKALFPVQRSNRGAAEKSSSGLVKLLRWHFGHPNFRGKQLDAIQAVLSGRDCFCLMPTGGGKSMCYQIPALAKPSGIVLVVSPLIALMENQVMDLKEKGIAAEFLSSTQTSSVRNKIHEDLNSGKPSIRLLYVTPELIATAGFMSKLTKIHSRGLLNLIAIDEAHCISTWGHDFRPSYRQLSSLRNHLPDVPILALTATAVPKVQNDVIGSLHLHDPLVLKSSFNRPNIYYEVRYKELLDDVYADLSSVISSCGDVCAIVYCLERTACDALSAHLSKTGISSAAYHAGLTNKLRTSVLDDWISSKIQVVVATVAFGMGIDRKDVRLVIHFNIPKSMEAFYQESGRAGRDQLPCRSLLYYGVDDRKRMEFILRNAQSKKLQSPSSQDGLSKKDDGLLKKSLSDFNQMVEYCESSGCRRRKILESFGEQVSTSLCERSCDACKHPNLVSRYLQELAATCAARQRSAFSQIVMASSNKKSEDQMSEYWNRGDEGSCSEEDISESDGSEDSFEAAKSLTKSKSRKLGLEEKLDLLEQAEEKYNQSKKNNQANNSISQSLREASKQRLSNAMLQAKQRLENMNTINVQTAAEVLESECFRQYGKNRTVYHSRVLGTVRWLSTASSADLANRLGIHHLPSNNLVAKEDSPETLPSSFSEDKLNASPETEIHGNHCLGTSTSSVTSPSCPAHTSTSMNSGTTRTSSPPHSACSSRKLPAIPSFSEFVNSKKLQANSSNASPNLPSKRQKRQES